MGLYCLDCHAQNPNDSGTLEHKLGCSFGSDQLNSEIDAETMRRIDHPHEFIDGGTYFERQAAAKKIRYDAIQTLINKARVEENEYWKEQARMLRVQSTHKRTILGVEIEYSNTKAGDLATLLERIFTARIAELSTQEENNE